MAAKSNDTAKIIMRGEIYGLFENRPGVKRGDVLELPQDHAERCVKSGIAQYDLTGELGTMYADAH
ncbi:hypothetical protein [Mycobacterium asiaticum]|uniref:hypothetical protein n=1 Tax=Mycobacterium asiaticum TaxID=1790 RepID=UPI00055D5404|nr:hypothetical protein [Mycobacterium asiaticum]ORA17076.1 hypothetical protein BST16_05255 [Mycobacterium asiaticum DSM 44297]